MLPAQCMKLTSKVYDFVKSNARNKKCELIEVIPDVNGTEIEIYASHVKSGTIIVSDRIFVDAKYIYPEENLVLMSSIGN